MAPGAPTATVAPSVPTATAGAPTATPASRTIRGATTSGTGATAAAPTVPVESTTSDHSLRIADQSPADASEGETVPSDLTPAIIETTADTITVEIDLDTVGAADRVEIAYGLDPAYGSRVIATLSEDGTRYEAVIGPASPGTTYHLQVVVTQGSTERTGEDVTVTTLSA